MVFARMAKACLRREFPASERGEALDRRACTARLEPGIKTPGDLLHIAPHEMPHVVEAHAAPHNQHTLLPQWRQGFTDSDVLSCVQPALERHLKGGDVRLGERDLERR